MTIQIPYSAACERNQDPILEVIRPYLQRSLRVLEIGSGTGQHAIHFARAIPELVWQPSDQKIYLDGLNAQLGNTDLDNILPVLEIDVTRFPWQQSTQKYSMVYSANTLHIMSEFVVECFFKGLPEVMTQDATLCLYGPFKYGGSFTSESNQQFDESLRSRGMGSGIRDIEWIQHLAAQLGLTLIKDHPMPANNQCLIFQTS